MVLLYAYLAMLHSPSADHVLTRPAMVESIDVELINIRGVLESVRETIIDCGTVATALSAGSVIICLYLNDENPSAPKANTKLGTS